MEKGVGEDAAGEGAYLAHRILKLSCAVLS